MNATQWLDKQLAPLYAEAKQLREEADKQGEQKQFASRIARVQKQIDKLEEAKAKQKQYKGEK